MPVAFPNEGALFSDTADTLLNIRWNMKRDFDLIRNLLQEVEAAKAGTTLTSHRAFQHQGYDASTIVEHLELLIEAGLLRGTPKSSMDGPVVISCLTWSGHDFLHSMRDDTIWQKAKESVLLPAASASFEILLEWLKWQAKLHLGMP
jgi:hypothetical protein